MEDRLRILLCEDDENLGMLLREYLQAKGFNADLFADGESGYKDGASTLRAEMAGVIGDLTLLGMG